MKLPAKRDALEPLIVEALRAAGCTVWRLDQPVDLLVGHRGRTLLAEVKSGRAGRLTRGQAAFLETWRGGPVYVLRSVEDAVAMVGVAE